MEERYDFECDNDDFDVAVARRLERLRRRSGQRSGDSHRSLDFKTASQSLQSPQSLEWLQKKFWLEVFFRFVLKITFAKEISTFIGPDHVQVNCG